MLKLISIISLASSFAFAHIDQGKWVGQTDAGVECSMTVGAQTFENNMPHPLNERIAVEINGDKYSLYHPRLIDVATVSAGFDHDHFHAILATKAGGKALVVDMAHTAEFEGPTGFHVINHEYKSNKREVLNCSNIKLK